MRALLLVLDSVGIGGAPDAAAYGDAGANTLRHIFEAVTELQLPNLDSLGLGALLGGTRFRASGVAAQNFGRAEARPSGARASYGRMRERSAGKDTTTGHWELAGAILDEPFATFEKFPDDLVRQIEQAASVKFLGNYASSGTEILKELGAEHVKTGRPILYTSADSVLQIAAHEEVIPVERLYEVCECARKAADDYRIGRVIARPFIGEALKFQRTSRRHDFSLLPPRTILDKIPATGIGRSAIFSQGAESHRSLPTASNREGMERIAHLWNSETKGFFFANLVDFDMLFGHRRDVHGTRMRYESLMTGSGIFSRASCLTTSSSSPPITGTTQPFAGPIIRVKKCRSSSCTKTKRATWARAKLSPTSPPRSRSFSLFPAHGRSGHHF